MPRHEELLSSWVVRTAHANGLGAWSFVNLHWRRDPFWNRDPDRLTLSRWFERFAELADVPPECVEAMTLASARRALGESGAGIMPTILAVGVWHTKRRLYGLQYCPDCLAAHPGTFRRAWRSALLTTCPLHDRPLRDACPRCDAPLAPHRAVTRGRDVCARCSHYLPHELSGPPAIDRRQVPRHDGLVAGLLDGSPLDVTMARDLRTILGLATGVRLEMRLRAALGLAPQHVPKAEPTFELMRSADRRRAMEVAAAWIADWPDNFRAGAAAIRLSQISFAGRRLGPALAAEVAQLPPRIRPPRRGPGPPIHDATLRRLARTDRSAYQLRRAARIDWLTR